jgi:23S rRNA pseudouridine955/2504/2580 synthase
VYVSDKFSEGKKDLSFLSVPDSIDVVYEDDNIIIVNKPVGIAVHCDNEHQNDTMINRIRHYLYNSGCYNPDSESSFAPALCSRLDKNTTGLITAAKNSAALREVNEAIRCGKVHKIYRCITSSPPPDTAGIITAYHFKEPVGNIVKISSEFHEGWKEIKTGYRVLKRNNELTLIEVTLYTGRTHQIRSHLAYINAPILGDTKYGNKDANRKYKVNMQALCSYSLSFEFDEESPLYYLNEKTFIASEPWFMSMI